jgi:DNA-binding LytR/AlgR family response regulator
MRDGVITIDDKEIPVSVRYKAALKEKLKGA